MMSTRPSVTCLLAVVLLSATPSRLHAQAPPAPAIHETFPELLPPDHVRWQPAPTPRTFGDPSVVQSGLNLRILDPVSPTELEQADARAAAKYADVRPAPPRVGLTRSVQPAIRLPGDDAVAAQLSDGRTVWVLAVQSPGARALRVHFSAFDVTDSTVVLYAPGAESSATVGPFTGAGPNGEGEFWSPSVPGAEVIIEVVGQQPPRFTIDAVLHRDRGPDEGDPRADCEGACPCHLDVMCYGDPPVDVAARQATGRMLFVQDGEEYVCTGTLLADLDPYTYVPYFLTANHCIDSQAVLNTLEVTWLYQANTCDGSVPNPDTLPKSYGGVLLHTSGYTFGNDATFARLNGALPSEIGFAGWTTNEEVGAVGIHHPAGSYKRVVFGHYVPLATDCGPDCGCPAPANYAFYKDDDGLIQGGSSGSGMFTTGGQLIGQLFGHCSLCPDAEDCEHFGDWCMIYGEFDQTYPDIYYWLELGGSIHVDDSNTSPPWDGSPTNPFPTVSQGYNFVWSDGLRLVIHGGNYPETLTFNTPLTVVGSGGIARIGDTP